MKDQLSSPSAVAQAEKKNRQVSGCFAVYTRHKCIELVTCLEFPNLLK